MTLRDLFMLLTILSFFTTDYTLLIGLNSMADLLVTLGEKTSLVLLLLGL